VSFFVPSRVVAGTNIRVGGFAATAWKKLKGARFVTPSGEIVEIQAIGLGRIVLVIHW
jgi:hypothetical protein